VSPSSKPPSPTTQTGKSTVVVSCTVRVCRVGFPTSTPQTLRLPLGSTVITTSSYQTLRLSTRFTSHSPEIATLWALALETDMLGWRRSAPVARGYNGTHPFPRLRQLADHVRHRSGSHLRPAPVTIHHNQRPTHRRCARSGPYCVGVVVCCSAGGGSAAAARTGVCGDWFCGCWCLCLGAAAAACGFRGFGRLESGRERIWVIEERGATTGSTECDIVVPGCAQRGV
jgi:hypothetical protein